MNRLKQLRNSRGITQDELGRMLGVQKAAICKYENGRVNMPNSVIMRLVEIFQVSADYLLGTDEVVPLLKSNSAKLSSSSMRPQSVFPWLGLFTPVCRCLRMKI